MYKVTEIFQSIQGEGLHTGQPCNFIRLAGCPNHCNFCDTDFSETERLSAAAILKQLDPLLTHVVITGGEPMAQGLAPLTTILHNHGFFIQLETSGWYSDIGSALDTYRSCNFVSLSPKATTHYYHDYFYGEVKWLVPPTTLDDIVWKLAPYHWLQPVNDGLKINRQHLEQALGMLMHANVPSGCTLRLSPQVHKLIGVR